MTVRERHIGRRCGDGQIWQPKQFACLQDKGHLILRIGIVEEISTLWQAVEGHLMREDVGLHGPEIEQELGTVVTGARFVAGANVGTGRDWTLFALTEGKVRFDKDGHRVNIDPVAASS